MDQHAIMVFRLASLAPRSAGVARDRFGICFSPGKSKTPAM